MINQFQRLPIFGADRRGAVSVMFALILLPAMLMIGSAVDFSMAVRAKSNLKGAADMGALAAARSYVSMVGPTSSENAKIEAIAKAKQTGAALFKANVDSGVSNADVTIDLDVGGGGVKATANFSGSSPGFLMRIAGFKTLSIQGSVEATLDQATVASPKNFFLVVDTSQSMGIGGSLDDMNKLNRQGCIFGCHNRRAQYWWEPIYHAIAKRDGIKMRIDYAREAVKKMIDNASTGKSSANFKFAIYKMHDQTLDVGVSLTGDYARLRSAADAIDTTDVPYVYYTHGQTYFQPALDRLSSIVSSSASTGSSNYVFIITDGLLDTDCTPWDNSHCTGPLDPSWCDSFKNNGATVGVLYTTYIKFLGLYGRSNDDSYNAYVAPVIDKIAPALKSCASPGFFFEAQDGAAIQSKMDEMFTKAMPPGNLRLSK